MRSIDTDRATRRDELVNNIAFIKQHRRYPFTVKTVMPLVTSVALLGVFLWLAWGLLIGRKESGGGFPLLILFIFCVPVVVAIARYFNLIGFRAIHTSFDMAENTRVLRLFLEQHKLVTFQHPSMEGIFQIISRNISAVGEDREALVFVADDKRILVNSHYTSSRKWFRFLSPPTHEKEIIKCFIKWLSDQERQGRSDIVSKRF